MRIGSEEKERKKRRRGKTLIEKERYADAEKGDEKKRKKS